MWEVEEKNPPIRWRVLNSNDWTEFRAYTEADAKWLADRLNEREDDDKMRRLRTSAPGEPEGTAGNVGAVHEAPPRSSG